MILLINIITLSIELLIVLWTVLLYLSTTSSNTSKWLLCWYNEDSSNKKDPKFKVGDNLRISKYKTIFAKRYTPNSSEVFIINKIKNTIPWTYAISGLNGEEITGSLYEKNCKKLIKKNLE